LLALDCRVGVYRCIESLDAGDLPTWNARKRRADVRWSKPGSGEDDADLVGEIELAVGVAGELESEELAAALKAVVAGEAAWLIFRRADVGANVVSLTAGCEIEWMQGV